MIALTWLFRAFIIGGIVKFVLNVIGVGVVSYFGYDLILSQLYSYAGSLFSSGPAEMNAILGLAGVPQAINLILSGVNIRMALFATSKFKVFG